MTLIVSLRATDGLVLAADSRGTIGDPRGLTAINDSYTKLFRLSRCCGLGVSGASELGAKLVDDLESQLSEKGLEFADEILYETRTLIRIRYDDWFGKFPVDKRPGINVSLVGYHQVNKDTLMPRTYLLSSQLDFAPQLFPNGNCLHGVPQYAVYLMHRLYDPQMNVESAVRLAAYLITETATQDPKVGGPIHISTIVPEEGYKELPSDGVDDIVKLNNEQNQKLRRFFYKEESDV